MTTRMPCWNCAGKGWHPSDDDQTTNESCNECNASGWIIIGASMETKSEGDRE